MKEDGKMKKQKEILITQDAFKRNIFEIVMDAGEMIPEGVQLALLNTINRYEIGPVWMKADGKGPCVTAHYYFIRVKGMEDFAMIATWDANSRTFQTVQFGRKIYHYSDIEDYSTIQMPK